MTKMTEGEPYDEDGWTKNIFTGKTTNLRKTQTMRANEQPSQQLVEPTGNTFVFPTADHLLQQPSCEIIARAHSFTHMNPTGHAVFAHVRNVRQCTEDINAEDAT